MGARRAASQPLVFDTSFSVAGRRQEGAEPLPNFAHTRFVIQSTWSGPFAVGGLVTRLESQSQFETSPFFSFGYVGDLAV